MATSLQPLGRRVLIRPADAETTLASGLVLPTPAAEENVRGRGRVIAVGPGTVSEATGELIKPMIAPGVDVLFSRYHLTETELDGETFVLVDEKDVLGVITTEAA